MMRTRNKGTKGKVMMKRNRAKGNGMAKTSMTNQNGGMMKNSKTSKSNQNSGTTKNSKTNKSNQNNGMMKKSKTTSNGTMKRKLEWVATRAGSESSALRKRLS